MDVNRAQSISPIQNNGGGGSGQGQTPHREPDDASDSHKNSGIGDAYEVEGLAAEITPGVQLVLDKLAAEIEPLRRQLALAQEREQNLREDLAKHAFLPVPGRREFLRELNHVLNHLGDLTALPSLVVMHLVNGDDVRRRHGRAVLDQFLVHVSNQLGNALQPTDVLGNLGGNDFAIILLGLDSAGARARAEGLVRTLATSRFNAPGEHISPNFVYGVAELSRGATAEASISAADRTLSP